ncbi:hypothetical protein Tco_0336776 [Tanacetum coccineum]
MENELWNLTIKGTDVIGYTKRFQELALLCPCMVTPEEKKIEQYIWGLTDDIQGNITSSKLTKIQNAIRMAHNLMARLCEPSLLRMLRTKGSGRTIKRATMFSNQTKDTMWSMLIVLGQLKELGHYRSECPDELKREINHAVSGKLRDKNAEESWVLIEELALYDNEGWNDPRDFAKPVKLTKDKSSEKVLVREAVSSTVTKYVNAISFVKVENNKETNIETVVKKNVVEPIKILDKEDTTNEEKGDKSNGNTNEDSTRWGKYVDILLEMPSSQLIGYYLKHKINERTIEGLEYNHKYNDYFLATRLGKMNDETYNLLHIGPIYNAILKKKLVRKDER